MIHASPFFETILTGEWAETNNNLTKTNQQQTNLWFDSNSSNSLPVITSSPTTNDELEQDSFDLPQPNSNSSTNSQLSTDNNNNNSGIQNRHHTVEARIYLKEERDASFQDLLMFVYPHLECVCTWHNASDLMTMSQKFDMPLLKRHVLSFLLSSVAGKPIEAMRIAEEHQLSELYRESSRFLLDNWQGWDIKELENLSSHTLLKLEKRRTWFLERLLKLGLVNSSRDYVCPPSCPDPQLCTKLVDDKWRSAWAASFKFGPPQPSSVYRALRCLEPSLHSPALLLPHTSCQQHALRFFADLFDRMFSQFTPRGGGGGSNGNSLNVTTGIGNGSLSNNNQNSTLVNSNTTTTPVTGLDVNPTTTPNNNNTTTTTTTTTTATTTPNNGSSSNTHTILNLSDHNKITIRKAKYFLHVELFDKSLSS